MDIWIERQLVAMSREKPQKHDIHDIDALRYARLGTALHETIEEQISPEKLDRFLEMLEAGNK